MAFSCMDCCVVDEQQGAETAAKSAPEPQGSQGEEEVPHRLSLATTTIRKYKRANSSGREEVDSDASEARNEFERITHRGAPVTCIVNLYDNDFAGWDDRGHAITSSSVALLSQTGQREAKRSLEPKTVEVEVEVGQQGSLHGNHTVLNMLSELSTDGWWLSGIIDCCERHSGESGGVSTKLLLALQRDPSAEKTSRLYEAGSEPINTKARKRSSLLMPHVEGYLWHKLNNGLRLCAIYRDPLDKEVRFIFERIGTEKHELELSSFRLPFTSEQKQGKHFYGYDRSAYARVASSYAAKGWLIVGGWSLPNHTICLACVGPPLSYISALSSRSNL